MKHFLRIAALLALFAFPSAAEATGKFLVLCTTSCTWDNTNDAIWSTASGGTNNTTHPVSTDTATIDNNSCVGGVTCTITTGAVTIAVQSITWGSCTASTTGCIIDASVNNTNFTISGGSSPFNGSGSGTRKWLAGTGTYTITQTNANNPFNMSPTTNDQGSVFSGATWVINGAVAGTRSFDGGTGFSFGPTTIAANSSGGCLQLTGTNTFSTLTLAAPNCLTLASSTTVTGALTETGTSSSSLVFISSSAVDTVRTLTLGAANTGSWVALRAITTAGAGALNLTSCTDLLRNTLANSGACTAPVVGGGGGGRIIGG